MRDENWEHCNIQFGPDPYVSFHLSLSLSFFLFFLTAELLLTLILSLHRCEKSTGVHFD